MGVAVSANVPVVLLTLYWRGLTTAGALTGGLFGLVTSVGLIVIGPAVKRFGERRALIGGLLFGVAGFTVFGAASAVTYIVSGADGSLTPVLANSSRWGRAPRFISRCQRSVPINCR